MGHIQDIRIIGVGVQHLNRINIKRHMVAVEWELPDSGEKVSEKCHVYVGGERVDAVAVAPEGVGTDDDALLRGVVVHLGAISLGIGVVGDAAWLAKVAAVGSGHEGVGGVGAQEARLLPMEEVDLIEKGGEADAEGVVTAQRDPLLSSRRVGKEAVGPPAQTVCRLGDQQTVADRVIDMLRVGHKQRVGHRDGVRTRRLNLCIHLGQKREQNSRQQDELAQRHSRILLLGGRRLYDGHLLLVKPHTEPRLEFIKFSLYEGCRRFYEHHKPRGGLCPGGRRECAGFSKHHTGYSRILHHHLACHNVAQIVLRTIESKRIVQPLYRVGQHYLTLLAGIIQFFDHVRLQSGNAGNQIIVAEDYLAALDAIFRGSAIETLQFAVRGRRSCHKKFDGGMAE